MIAMVDLSVVKVSKKTKIGICWTETPRLSIVFERNIQYKTNAKYKTELKKLNESLLKVLIQRGPQAELTPITSDQQHST